MENRLETLAWVHWTENGVPEIWGFKFEDTQALALQMGNNPNFPRTVILRDEGDQMVSLVRIHDAE